MAKSRYDRPQTLWDSMVDSFLEYWNHTRLPGSIIGVFGGLILLILGTWDSTWGKIQRATQLSDFEVQTDTSIVTDQVRIDWHVPDIPYATVYDHGETLMNQFFDRGNHFYAVYYADSLLGEFAHYHPEKMMKHTYRILVERDSTGCLALGVTIEGPSDSLRWIQPPGCMIR